MTSRYFSPSTKGRQTVLFPTPLQSVGAVVLFVVTAGIAIADMPAHGRPGNIRTLPGVSIGASASLGDGSSQQYQAVLEGKVSHKLLLFIDSGSNAATESDIAMNGDLEVEGGGSGGGVYYQLPQYRQTYLTLAVRQRTDELKDAEAIITSSSRVNFNGETSATEIALIAEHESWSKGGWQPYVGFGFRQTKVVNDLRTTGGRQISNESFTANTGQGTAGIHFQHKKLSWYAEASASSSKKSQWQFHTGVRFGFFHREPNGK